MTEKSQMSPWTTGPRHNWRTTDKTRRDQNADVIEEIYADRSIYVFATATVCVCAACWWWQTNLDGWLRALILIATILVTIYVGLIAVSALIFGFVSRFIRNV